MNNIDDDICFENIEIFELSRFSESFVKFDNFYQLKIQVFNRNICQDHFKNFRNNCFASEIQIRIFFLKIQNLFVIYINKRYANVEKYLTRKKL